MNRQTTAALWLAVAASFAPAAQAGQACEQKAADPQAITDGMALAVATAQALDASGGG